MIKCNRDTRRFKLCYHTEVITVRSNLYLLMAQKAARERRRITLRTVSDETGISYYTLSAIAKETIREYPRDVLAQLCVYFQCNVGDLLTLTEVPDTPTPTAC